MGVVSDVQAYLQAQGLVDGATDWPSVRRRVHDQSNRLVVLTEDGGPEPEIPRAEGLGSGAMKVPGVQVLVRGDPWDGDAALAKARAIHDALHGLAGVTMGEATYSGVRAMTPEPVFLGFEENGRPQFTVAFRLLTTA